ADERGAPEARWYKEPIMSTATHDVRTMSGRQGWRSLYWMVPISALYIALTFAAPWVNASGAPAVIARLVPHVFIALGLWIGLERAELSASQRRNTWLAVMIPLTLWLAVVWSAAINGFFNTNAPGGVGGPLSLVRWLPTIIAAPILLGSRRIGQVLDA